LPRCLNEIIIFSRWLKLTVFNSLSKYPYANQNQIWLDSINGYQEHVDCLISLGKDQCISQIMHSLKGESSYWINKSKLIPEHFMWQDDYWAVGVSESGLNSTRSYIFDQEKHHFSISFHKELDDFIVENHFNLISNNK
jgi:putative transposase